MKITVNARYGLRILLDLALFAKEKPRTIQAISDSQQISKKLMTRLVINLRQAGFIKSIRGINGGLQLIAPPQSITLLSIVEATQGKVSILECLSNEKSCPRRPGCHVSSIWNKVNQNLIDSLNSFTLADVIEQYKKDAADSNSQIAELYFCPAEP